MAKFNINYIDIVIVHKKMFTFMDELICFSVQFVGDKRVKRVVGEVRTETALIPFQYVLLFSCY